MRQERQRGTLLGRIVPGAPGERLVLWAVVVGGRVGSEGGRGTGERRGGGRVLRTAVRRLRPVDHPGIVGRDDRRVMVALRRPVHVTIALGVRILGRLNLYSVVVRVVGTGWRAELNRFEPQKSDICIKKKKRKKELKL